eukprot:scaffold2897_cov178-Amphora_coffeaeformis.AAC.28
MKSLGFYLLLMLLGTDAFSGPSTWSRHSHYELTPVSSSSLDSTPSPDTQDESVTAVNTPTFFLKDDDEENVSEDAARPSTTKTPPQTSDKHDELWRRLLDIGVEGTISVLKGLRWGLAQTLTASLPVTEKAELLKRLQPPMSADTSQREESSTAERGSVAEEAAVSELASADAAEAAALQEKLQSAVSDRVSAELDVQRYRLEQEKASARVQKLNTEKQALREQIQCLEQSIAEMKQEQANSDSLVVADNAEKVMEAQNDLKCADELLQKREEQQVKLEIVEKELREGAQRIRQMQTQQSTLIDESSSSVPTHLSPKEYRSLSEEEKGQLKAKRAAVKATQGLDEEYSSHDTGHPVLGPVVADLGYKRIHLVSSGKLGTIPIWEKQRTYRNSRAKIMAADKQKSFDLGFPGIICLYEDENGGLSILDGQHRIGMMQALREKRNQQQDQHQGESETSTDISLPTYDKQMFDNVLVEVYVQPSNRNADAAAKHAEKIFLEINKAEPIKLIDMPGVASAADRAIISEAIDELERKFPRMFSPSQRNRVPNVNVDNVRNSIYGANVLRRHKLTTSKKLFDWLLVQNASLGSQYEGDEERRGYVSARSWSKASKYGFFLGLESSWLYK